MHSTNIQAARAVLQKGTTVYVPCHVFPTHRRTPQGYWLGKIETNKPTGQPENVKVCYASSHKVSESALFLAIMSMPHMVQVKCPGEAAFAYPALEVVKWIDIPTTGEIDSPPPSIPESPVRISTKKRSTRKRGRQEGSADGEDDEDSGSEAGHFSVHDTAESESSDEQSNNGSM